MDFGLALFVDCVCRVRFLKRSATEASARELSAIAESLLVCVLQREPRHADRLERHRAKIGQQSLDASRSTMIVTREAVKQLVAEAPSRVVVDLPGPTAFGQVDPTRQGSGLA